MTKIYSANMYSAQVLANALFALLRALLVALCFCVLATTRAQAGTDDDFDVYVIDSFSAQGLVEVVRPILPAGSSVQAYQGRLIVRTTAKGYHDVSQLLAQVDELPKSLRLSLRVAEHARTEQADHSANVVIVTDKTGRLVVGGSLSLSKSHQATQGNSLYTIKALNGYPARIGSGTLLALGNSIWGGVSGYTLLPVTTELEVLPQTLPSGQVRLSISQRYDRTMSGTTTTSIQTQSSATQVVAPLGRWVSMGSIVQQSQQSSSGTLGLGKRSSQYMHIPLEVKVDALP